MSISAVVVLSQHLFEPASYYRDDWNQGGRYPGGWFLRGWIRWDAGWYERIATDGYSYEVGRQSTVAYFPLYPMLIRAVSALGVHLFTAAFGVTLASGMASVLLFSRWCRDRLSGPQAWTALLCFVLYPYAWYLFGAMYADALFLALVLAAFLALERGHPIVAGSFGFLATATRPTGMAVFFGLVVLVLEKRAVVGRTVDRLEPLRTRLRRLRPADAGVLLTGGGLVAYMAYQWSRFGDPMAFAAAEAAPGWDHTPGPHTWFKVRIWDLITGAVVEPPGYLPGVIFQGAIAVACVAAVPAVIRRFGWGYGVFVAMVVGFSALSSKDFQGLGRYATAAFPVFAVYAIWMCDRPALRRPALVVSGTLLALLTSVYARGYYVA